MPEMALNAFSTMRDTVRGVVLAGTHRCNSTTNSDDDGTTPECGRHYKISDMAHQFDSPLPSQAQTDFQVMHDGLRTGHPTSNQLQMHGMQNNNPNEHDEGFEISDGGDAEADLVDEAVERAHAAYAAALTTAMNAGGLTAAEQTELSWLTTCQAYTIEGPPAVEVPASNRHCGRNSDQGQLERARGHGARWLHIEISRYIRDSSSIDPTVFNSIQPALRAIAAG
ncbi:hypothetical protein ACFQ1L_17370 [Phytohabitans flavus]|uniref:hypothetical protein n=1 Tax=Phytohabitans flavus TaxID=1076124 RepID=UPI003625F1CB